MRKQKSVEGDHAKEILTFFFVTGSPCEHNGVCVNTPGSYHCDCAQGFDGPRCEININECESSPCLNDGTCIDERGGFRCICMPGKKESCLLSNLLRSSRLLLVLLVAPAAYLSQWEHERRGKKVLAERTPRANSKSVQHVDLQQYLLEG